MRAISSAAFRWGLLMGSMWCLAGSHRAEAAISSVTVGDNFFNPSTLTINVNDRVRWVWSGGSSHSSTSNSGLWDSGVRGNGSTFTNTFGSAGNFPYHCVVHAGQTASITVQAANVLPTATITSPAASTIFAAPWSGTIQATASDSDGSVIKVDFFANTTKLGTVSNPPPTINFSVTNLAAGNYSLKAVPMDNRGATNNSATVAISVLTPGPIQLSAPQWLGNNSFRFSYSTTPGLRYILQRSNTLTSWTSLGTNTAANNPVTFTDSNATAPFNYYSVTLAPNP